MKLKRAFSLSVAILILIQYSSAQRKSTKNIGSAPHRSAYKKNRCDSLILQLSEEAKSNRLINPKLISYPTWGDINTDEIELTQSFEFGNGFRLSIPQRPEWLEPDFNLVHKNINGNLVYLNDEISGSFFIVANSEEKLQQIKNNLEFQVYQAAISKQINARWIGLPAEKVQVTFGLIDNNRSYKLLGAGPKRFAQSMYKKTTKARIAFEHFPDLMNNISSIDTETQPGINDRRRQMKSSFRERPRNKNQHTRPYEQTSGEIFLGELADAEGTAMVAALAAKDYSVPCEPNPLPYYFMEVFFSYAPRLVDLQVKVVISDPLLTGNKIELLGEKFGVTRFAVCNFKVPAGSGRKMAEFSVIDLQNSNTNNHLEGKIIYTTNANSGKLNNPGTFNMVLQSTTRKIVTPDTTRFKMFFAKNEYKFYDETTGEMISNINAANVNLAELNNRVQIFDPGETVKMRIQVTNNDRIEFISNITGFEMPPPISIGIVGDSYSAGEGAPENLRKPWIESDNGCDCHRSNLSGHHLGVCQFVKENPELDIQFKFLSCSGATIQNLINDPRYPNFLGAFAMADGYFNDRFHFPQLITLQNWMTNLKINRLSTIIMSIGGNNSGFGQAVARAFWPNDVSDVRFVSFLSSFFLDPVVLQFFRNQVNELRSVSSKEFKEESDATLEQSKQLYRILDAAIKAKVNADHIVLSAYINPMRGADMAICKGECVLGGMVWEPKEVEALEAFYNKMISTQRSMSRALNWIYDEEAKDLSRGHGFCNCESTYFNGPFNIENKNRCAIPCSTYFGSECMAHPNKEGYRKTYKISTNNQLKKLYLE